MRLLLCWTVAALVASCPVITRGQQADTKPIVERVVKAAGGEEKLLKTFRMKERLNVSSDPAKKGAERVSILAPPHVWWLGKTERVSEEKEPAIFLVWAWTLRALVDPKSKVEVLPDIVEADRQVFGLRVSETIQPAMDLYFDKTTARLLRIDWRSDIHRFDDWKEHDGATYAARCVGYKKSTGKPWYFTEVLELTRLKELPADLRMPHD